MLRPQGLLEVYGVATGTSSTSATATGTSTNHLFSGSGSGTSATSATASGTAFNHVVSGAATGTSITSASALGKVGINTTESCLGTDHAVKFSIVRDSGVAIDFTTIIGKQITVTDHTGGGGSGAPPRMIWVNGNLNIWLSGQGEGAIYESV